MLKQFNTNSTPRRHSVSTEFSRILSAAVINSHFRQMLLSNPVQAISNGYSGERFDIDGSEKVRLSSIKAATLADFATQLSQI